MSILIHLILESHQKVYNTVYELFDFFAPLTVIGLTSQKQV